MIGKRKTRTPLEVASKRQKRYRVEEVKYDPEARHEYLTGFHKRKVQRQKQAQETAALKERDERREQRAQLRAERQAHIDQLVAAMENGLPDHEEDEATDASQDPEGLAQPGELREVPLVDQEAEYEDDDRVATVTVEAVEITRGGLQKVDGLHVNDERNSCPDSKESRHMGARPKAKSVAAKPKRKKKKFRYESKTENKANSMRQKIAGRAKARSRQQK